MPPTASLSLDLDNLWAYLRVRGDQSWREFPTYLPAFAPRFVDLAAKRGIKFTVFVVGADAERAENRDAIRLFADSGHEIANHSFNHEPWMASWSAGQIEAELERAEQAIQDATGKRPRGFRGPGYACSPALLETLAHRGYHYDASLFPSVIGPLARLYYFSTAGFRKDEKKQRSALFGRIRDGFLPLKPFEWNTDAGRMLEIPVSTMPISRMPMHLSYIVWLAKQSERVALQYIKTALGVCRACGVQPSYLLHPLDFLSLAEAPSLAFFPGMQVPLETKLNIFEKTMDIFQTHFDPVPLAEHAERIRQAGKLKSVSPELRIGKPAQDVSPANS